MNDTMGDLNQQRGEPWSRANGNLYGNGTFNDFLSAGSLPGFPRQGTADQEFSANGWFGEQPLAIMGFGSLAINGVNFNSYSPKAVTVNGMTGQQPCGN